MSVLVNKTAPDFTAPAVMPNGLFEDNFSLNDLRGKYVVLFFWPLDFTFVCPSEIIAHDKRFDEFEKREAVIVGVSIDSQFTHFAWRNTPVNEGGIGPVSFPLVADVNHDITKAYGIEHDDGVALRASFLIDKEGVIQHQVVNNLPIGRNVDEMLRVVDALQFTEKYGEVCPAGWNQGDEGMKPTAQGVAEYLGKNGDNLYIFSIKKTKCLSGFICQFGIRCSVFDKRKKSFTERRMPNAELRVRNTAYIQTLKDF